MLNRWPVLTLVVISTALMSCSSDSDSAPDTAVDNAVDQTSAATVVTVEDTGDLPEGRGVVSDNPDGTRTVTSSYGTAIVPADPQRVVSVIGDVDFEAMLALGVKPIGAGTQGGTADSGFAPHLGDLVSGIEAIPWTDGVQFETILALEPDLIFVPDADTAAMLDDVATVVPRGSWTGADWKLDFLYVGEVLGLRDEAAAMIADYEADVAELSAELDPLIEGKTVLSPRSRGTTPMSTSTPTRASALLC